ncbi:hypothetical protein CDAR_550021, partial [Caerostris darwini]
FPDPLTIKRLQNRISFGFKINIHRRIFYESPKNTSKRHQTLAHQRHCFKMAHFSQQKFSRPQSLGAQICIAGTYVGKQLMIQADCRLSCVIIGSFPFRESWPDVFCFWARSRGAIKNFAKKPF